VPATIGLATEPLNKERAASPPPTLSAGTVKTCDVHSFITIALVERAFSSFARSIAWTIYI
jgi:hypothetical protein